MNANININNNSLHSSTGPCCAVFQGKVFAMGGDIEDLESVEYLELENPRGWSDGPSIESAEIHSSAFSSDNNIFVVNRNGRLDTFDGQNWHEGKDPEWWPRARADDLLEVTTTVKMTVPLKTLIAEARKRRSEDM